MRVAVTVTASVETAQELIRLAGDADPAAATLLADVAQAIVSAHGETLAALAQLAA